MSLKPLRCLFVEDSAEDVEEVQYKLRRAAQASGTPVPILTQCDSKRRLENALIEPWDVFFLDFHLIGLSVEEAIEMLKKAQPETPIILLTGSIDDASAAAVTIRHGAICHFLKDRLEGLPRAVEAAYEVRLLKEEKARLLKEEKEEKERQTKANLHRDRLEILGNLSVGIVHDMNNVLSVVLAGTELIRQKINPMDTRVLDAMERAVKRGAEMVQQILVFARGSNGSIYKPVGVEYLFGEIRTVLQSGSFPAVRSTINISIGTSKVLCDATQIVQVLVNLCLNARDAMPHGGEVHLSAQNVRHIEGQPLSINGNFVCITVRDTGTGIPDEALPKIFDAFFTTKEHGKGTGMGLANVKAIVDSHGGAIEVKTSKTGTAFNIYLPAADEEPVPKVKVESTFEGIGKTILVAEDEETMRLFLQLHLEAAGYRVLSAGNGPEALAQFRTGEHIDLLLTDLTMPVMSGQEITRNLRAMNFDLPIIYITAHDTLIPHEPEPSAILQKPFSRERLLSTIRNFLSH